MTRMLGFALLQAAALLYAHERISARKREHDALVSFCHMLEQLHGLLENDASPMPELFQKLAKRCEGEAAAFVDALNGTMPELGKSSFRELWQRAISRMTAFSGEAGQELDALGAVLGRYDLESQLKALDDCRAVLRKGLEKKKNDQLRGPYMTVGLSLSVSLILGILLI